MDMITLTLAVKKALEELGVKNEKTQGALTWDGSYDDVVQVMGVLPMGKISDNHVDLNSVDSVVVKYENGNTKTLTAANWIIQEEMGVQIMLSAEDEVPYVISSPADVEGMVNKGLYFTYSIEFYVEKITYATETIHPIDPKFIPGAVLPVVDLVGIEPSGENPVPEEIAKVVKTAIANALPIIVRANSVFNNTPVVKSLVAEFIDFGEGDMTGYIWEEKYFIGISPGDGEIYFMDMTGEGA